MRIGQLAGASLIARRLARVRIVALASPAYLARRGEPRHPTELLEHDCLCYTLVPHPGRWTFRAGGGGTIRVPVTGAFASNHGGALREAALAGLGVAFLPTFYADAALEQGTLRTILDEFSPAELGVHGVYPRGRLVPPKTRAFMDFLAERLPARLTRVPGR